MRRAVVMVSVWRPIVCYLDFIWTATGVYGGRPSSVAVNYWPDRCRYGEANWPRGPLCVRGQWDITRRNRGHPGRLPNGAEPCPFFKLRTWSRPGSHTNNVLYCAQTLSWQVDHSCEVQRFREINLNFKKFEKVQDVIKFKRVRKSSRSTLNHNCYRKTLSILNIVTMLNCMQYNALHASRFLTTAHFNTKGYTSIHKSLQ